MLGEGGQVNIKLSKMKENIVIVGSGSSMLDRAISALPNNVVIVDLKKQKQKDISYVEPSLC